MSDIDPGAEGKGELYHTAHARRSVLDIRAILAREPRKGRFDYTSAPFRSAFSQAFSH